MTDNAPCVPDQVDQSQQDSSAASLQTMLDANQQLIDQLKSSGLVAGAPDDDDTPPRAGRVAADPDLRPRVASAVRTGYEYERLYKTRDLEDLFPVHQR